MGKNGFRSQDVVLPTSISLPRERDSPQNFFLPDLAGFKKEKDSLFSLLQERTEYSAKDCFPYTVLTDS